MIGVKCHVCREVHLLKRDEGYKRSQTSSWRERYTYYCPEAKKEYKIYTQGELVTTLLS